MELDKFIDDSSFDVSAFVCSWENFAEKQDCITLISRWTAASPKREGVFELVDRVFIDLMYSTAEVSWSDSAEDLQVIAAAIAAHSSAREVYIVAIEKLGQYLSCVQCTDAEEEELVHAGVRRWRDGDTIAALSLVLDVVAADMAFCASREITDGRYQAIELAMEMLSGLLPSSDGFTPRSLHADEPVCSLAMPAAAPCPFFQTLYTGCLLALLRRCIASIADRALRRAAAEKVTRLLLRNGVELSRIICHPQRLQHQIFLLRTRFCKDRPDVDSAGNSSTGSLGGIPVKTIEGVLQFSDSSEGLESFPGGGGQGVRTPWDEIQQSSVQDLVAKACEAFPELRVQDLPHGARFCVLEPVAARGTAEARRREAWKFIEWGSVYGSASPVFGAAAESAAGPLGWDLVGIALYLQTLLSSEEPGMRYPAVYSRDHFRGVEGAAFLQVLKHPVVGPFEGLDLLLRLQQERSTSQPAAGESRGSFFVSPAASTSSAAALSLLSLGRTRYVKTSLTLNSLQRFSARVAQSIDAFAFAKILAEKLISRQLDDQQRTQGRDLYISFLQTFDDRNRMCLLRRLVHSCPSPSFAGFLYDIIRSCVVSAAATVDTFVANPRTWGVVVDEHYNDDFEISFQAVASSPFWSYFVVSWFIQSTLSKAGNWTSAQILERSDEIVSCVSLLSFICIRLSRRVDGRKEEDTERTRAFIGTRYLPLDEIAKNLLAIKTRLRDKLQRQMDSKPTSALSADSLRFEVLISNIDRVLGVFESWVAV